MNRSLLLIATMFISQTTLADWDLGIGVASFQEPIKSLDREYLPIPMVAYRGERFNFQITTLSYRISQWGDLGFSAQVVGRFDGYDPEDSPYLKGMSTRRDTLDYGFALDWKGLELSVSQDALSEHDGQIISLGYSHGIEKGKWMLMPKLAVNWQSDKRINYYYGVAQDEVATLSIDNQIFNRTAYAVDSRALIPELSLLTMYHLNPSWFLIGGASAEFYPEEITDSPLVEDDMAWGMFFGIAKHF
jgi:MipA family protein